MENTGFSTNFYPDFEANLSKVEPWEEENLAPASLVATAATQGEDEDRILPNATPSAPTLDTAPEDEFLPSGAPGDSAPEHVESADSQLSSPQIEIKDLDDDDLPEEYCTTGDHTSATDRPAAKAKEKEQATAEPEKGSEAKEGEFPLNLFPNIIVKIARTLENTRLYPVGYTVMSILFALSVVIGRSRVLVTRLGEFAANLFILLVGMKGTYKSHPLTWAIKPLLQHDARLIRKYEEDYAAYLRSSSTDKASGCAQEPPRPPLYLLNDTTPEALYTSLYHNQNGVGLYGDEASKILTQANRYSRQAELDNLLSLFSGAPVSIRRATNRHDKILDCPFLSVTGTIQPSRLFELFKGERYEAGLLDRFLIVAEFGYHAKPWNLTGEIADEFDAEKALKDIVKKLEHSRGEEYTLSHDAAMLIEGWQNEKEHELERNGTDIQFGVFRKMQIYCFRFALLLQVLWDLDSSSANPENVVSAINALRATVLTDHFHEIACGIAQEVAHAPVSAKEKEVLDALPNAFAAHQGLMIAKAMGMGKTAYYGMLGKINGLLLEKVGRGTYLKKFPGISARSHTNKFKS